MDDDEIEKQRRWRPMKMEHLRKLMRLGLNAIHIEPPGVDVRGRKSTGKTPTAQWRDENNQARTLKDIDRVFFDVENSNAGVALGFCNAGIVFVVDVDGPEGQEFLDQFGFLPPTYTVASGRDGGFDLPYRHYYYFWPTKDDVPSTYALERDDETVAHVDIKGEGGYVVAEGSLHENGNIYQVVMDRPIVPAPQWLIALVRRHVHRVKAAKAAVEQKMAANASAFKTMSERKQNRLSGWGRVALEGIVDDLRRAQDGKKHNELYKRSCKAGEIVHLVGYDAVRSALRGVVAEWGDRVANVDAAHSTIDKGIGKGVQNARWPDDRETARFDSAIIEAIESDTAAQIAAGMSHAEIVDAMARDLGIEPMQAIELARDHAVAHSGATHIMQDDIAVIESRASQVMPATREAQLDRATRDIQAEIDKQERIPGLMRAIGPEIARVMDMLSESSSRQPHIEGLVAIEMGRALCGLKNNTSTGLLAGAITIGAAPQGAGKSNTYGALDRFLTALGPACMLTPKPTSLQALRKSITTAIQIRHSGVHVITDEIGKMFGTMTGKRAVGYKAEIIDELLEMLPSTITKPYRYQMSVKDGDGEIVVLPPAMISVFGVGTPSSLGSILYGASTSDGTIPRCVVLRGVEGRLPSTYHGGKFTAPINQGVQAIINRAIDAHKEWVSNPTSARAHMVGGEIIPYAPIPAIYTTDAIDAQNAAHADFYVEALLLPVDSPRRAMLDRASEQVDKIALALAAFDNPYTPRVCARCIAAAVAVVKQSIDDAVWLINAARAAAREDLTPYSRCYTDVFAMLSASAKWITAKDMAVALRNHPALMRTTVLDDMAMAGEVVIAKRVGKTKPTLLYRLRRAVDMDSVDPAALQVISAA